VILAPLAAISIGIHLGTYHVERDRGYNEWNPGIYVRGGDWTAGAYRNSERGNSAYVAYKALALGRASLHVGAVTGYKRGPGPLAVVEFAVGDNLKLIWIPPAPQAGKGGVHFAYEF
jgi:hypothetical protein